MGIILVVKSFKIRIFLFSIVLYLHSCMETFTSWQICRTVNSFVCCVVVAPTDAIGRKKPPTDAIGRKQVLTFPQLGPAPGQQRLEHNKVKKFCADF